MLVGFSPQKPANMVAWQSDIDSTMVLQAGDNIGQNMNNRWAKTGQTGTNGHLWRASPAVVLRSTCVEVWSKYIDDPSSVRFPVVFQRAPIKNEASRLPLCNNHRNEHGDQGYQLKLIYQADHPVATSAPLARAAFPLSLVIWRIEKELLVVIRRALVCKGALPLLDWALMSGRNGWNSRPTPRNLFRSLD